MEALSVQDLLKTMDGGISGFLLVISFVLVIVTGLIEMMLAYRLYRSHKRLGGARGAIASALESDWNKSMIPLNFLRVIAKFAIFVCAALSLYMLVSLGLRLYMSGALADSMQNWRLPVASRLADVQISLTTLLLALGIRLLLGGVSGIMLQRCRAFAFSGQAVPLRRDLERVKSLERALDDDLRDDR